MPVFKTEEIRINTVFGPQYVKVKIMINAKGLFYTNIDKEMHDAAKGTLSHSDYEIDHSKDQMRIVSKTYEDIVAKIQSVCKVFMEPEITKIPVIRYNIESHISFAQDNEGNIYPNSGYPGARWQDLDDPKRAKFGMHHAANPSKGGYSLTVGAVAELKIIYKYGKQEKIEYQRYYGESGSHHGSNNPAERLNSWCSFTLGYSPKEIPYTDDAAEFFYNLMYSIAKLSKMIQDNTFEQENLLKLISNSTKNLLTANLETIDVMTVNEDNN